MSQELSALSKPMGVVGLIFAVAMIWLAVALQIGDVGPSIALTLVLRAMVETILVVVLFVVAAVFPWGTVAAIAHRPDQGPVKPDRRHPRPGLGL